MAKYTGFPSTITPLAIALSATFMVVACGSAGNDKTLITAAKPTELEAKLSNCATTKLSGQVKTVEGAPRNVCRVDSDGLVKDVSLRPTFGAFKDKNRIALLQVFAVRLDGKSSPMPLISESEEMLSKRLRREHEVRVFLRQVCQPLVEGILARSGITSRLYFRAKKIGDLPAQANDTGSNSGDGSDANDDDALYSTVGSTVGSTGAAVTAGAPPASPAVVSPQRKSRQNKVPKNSTDSSTDNPVRVAANQYHAILDLISGPDGQIKIRDELDPVLSGSIALAPGTSPTTEQKHFCSQLAVRIVENYGLAEGRDCKARGKVSGKCAVEGEGGKCLVDKVATIEPDASADVASAPKGAESALETAVSQDFLAMTLDSEVTSLKLATDDSDPTIGLMKPGRTTDDMSTVKLSRKELAEVLNPVCGPIEDSSQVKK